MNQKGGVDYGESLGIVFICSIILLVVGSTVALWLAESSKMDSFEEYCPKVNQYHELGGKFACVRVVLN